LRHTVPAADILQLEELEAVRGGFAHHQLCRLHKLHGNDVDSMTDEMEISKRQLRYLKDQERKGRERWEGLTADEQEEEWLKFKQWFLRRLEKSESSFPYGFEILLDDAHVKARNVGLLNDRGFQVHWAKLELELREMMEKAHGE
jgi:hypothetical protein